MPDRRASVALWLLAALTMPAQGRAQEDCHIYAAPEGQYEALAELTYSDDGLIRFTLPGAPYAVFAHTCLLGGNDTVECSVDCDGGNVTITRTAGGVRMVFSHLRIEEVRLETLAMGLAQWDADGLPVEGTFDLLPAEPAQCMALTEREQPLLLEPGDYYRIVADLERKLALAGEFTEVPDWHFTQETAEAVRRFQEQSGLAGDGKVDRALLRLLGVSVGYAYGGC